VVSAVSFLADSEVAEAEMNPVLIKEAGVVAVDALVAWTSG
jgi:hypothetical protein